MTAVHATCGDCGPVRFHHAGLSLRHIEGVWMYGFVCPDCGLANRQITTPRIVDLLIREGVRAVGSSITDTEIATFADRLSDPHALEELTR